MRFVPSCPSPEEKRRTIELIRRTYPRQADADMAIADLESAIREGWYLVENPDPTLPRVGSAPETVAGQAAQQG